MKYIFLLGYNRAKYLSDWMQKVNSQDPFKEDKKFYYIDNGQQTYRDDFLNSILLHQTEQTIFCAGGWNLICYIGFNLLNLDKLIIGQEDAIFTDEILDAVWENITSNNIQGTYDRSFEFSLFGIHRDTYFSVGEFDENFIQAGCEDGDYKHRCKMKGVSVSSLGVSADYNESSTSDIRKNLGNAEYLESKWGKAVNLLDRIYEYDIPFNGKIKWPFIREDYINYLKLPKDIIEFRSKYEKNRVII
jgi:hypothetical protein